MENAVVRLGVARLTEGGEAAGYCRHQPQRALEGYCLVAGDEWGCRVTLYLQNGRTLAERTGGGLFYYEGWLVTPEEPVSLGVFNTGAAGEGSAHCEPEAWALERAVGIRVTAEPHGGSLTGHRPVLEGQLIWLQGQPTVAPEADSDPVSAPGVEGPLDSAFEPDRAPVNAVSAPEPLPAAQWHPAHQAATAGGAEPWSEMLSRAAAAAAAATATATAAGGTPALAAVPPDAEAGPQAESEPEAEAQPGPEPEPESAPAADAQADPAPVADARDEPQPEAADTPPDTPPDAPAAAPAPATGPAATPTDDSTPDAPPPGENFFPEPPSMVTTVIQLTRNVALSSVHPMAPRAVGAAVLRLRDGQVTLTLRGLPAPPALGRDPATNRPFNAYRVWLLNQRTGQGSPLGICERLWGESYRFQSGVGLVLNRHDTLLVTAGDRNDIAPAPDIARVLLGNFQGA